VAAALAAFSAGLVFNGAMLMLNRAFFSLQQNWIPTWIALGNLALNAALDGVFYRFGVWGIPLATSVVNIAGTVALLFVLRRRLEGRLGFGETASGVLRISVASAASAGVAFAVWWVVDSRIGRGTGPQILSLGLGIAAAIDVYLAACLLLRVREIGPLLSLRARVRHRR
jgi:peptidoglycan biosynthesis protein MviN/MurJ (putative lipid II flippase)